VINAALFEGTVIRSWLLDIAVLALEQDPGLAFFLTYEERQRRHSRRADRPGPALGRRRTGRCGAVAFYDRRASCPSGPSVLPAAVGGMNFCIDVSLQAYTDRGPVPPSWLQRPAHREHVRSTATGQHLASTQYPGISDVDRSQPDLFARAFFTELFTRDYAGSFRGNLLSWVQANTGIDQAKVSTLLPADLLMRTSTASLTARFPVVPDPAGWQSLAAFHGTSTVVPASVRVSTPPDVQQHILDGSAPAGWTEKLMTGTVTTRTVVNGHPVAHAASVALRLVLWGPPNLGSWSLIEAADYNTVAVS
jgi:hypothetical protein